VNRGGATEAGGVRDVEEPELFRDLFPYDEVPRVGFEGEAVPLDIPR